MSGRPGAVRARTSFGALPYTMLVAPEGKVLVRKQDEINPLEVRKAIVDYLGCVYK